MLCDEICTCFTAVLFCLDSLAGVHAFASPSSTPLSVGRVIPTHFRGLPVHYIQSRSSPRSKSRSLLRVPSRVLDDGIRRASHGRAGQCIRLATMSDEGDQDVSRADEREGYGNRKGLLRRIVKRVLRTSDTVRSKVGRRS